MPDTEPSWFRVRRDREAMSWEGISCARPGEQG